MKFLFKELTVNYIKIKLEKFWITKLIWRLITLFILILFTYKLINFSNCSNVLHWGITNTTIINEEFCSHFFTYIHMNNIILIILTVLFSIIISLIIIHLFFSLNAVLKDYLRDFNLQLYWFVYLSLIYIILNCVYLLCLDFYTIVETKSMLYWFCFWPIKYIGYLIYQFMTWLDIIMLLDINIIIIIISFILLMINSITSVKIKTLKFYYYEKIVFVVGFLVVNVSSLGLLIWYYDINTAIVFTYYEFLIYIKNSIISWMCELNQLIFSKFIKLPLDWEPSCILTINKSLLVGPINKSLLVGWGPFLNWLIGFTYLFVQLFMNIFTVIFENYIHIGYILDYLIFPNIFVWISNLLTQYTWINLIDIWSEGSPVEFLVFHNIWFQNFILGCILKIIWDIWLKSTKNFLLDQINYFRNI